jgi:Uncharacterised nucleotidyltransferase
LGTERCALALTRRLAADEALPELSSVAGAELREAALGESQRVLRARAQLDELDRVAREQGRLLCVLKGGASVGGDDAVDLLDLDVLLDERDVAEIGAALRRVGCVVQDPHTQGDAAVPAAGRLPVELHVAAEEKVGLLDGGALQRSRPFPAHPALTVLAPADQLWNLLCHVSQSHLNRQGNLRDLLLMSAAAASCSDDERRLVTRRIEQHAHHEPLEHNLAFALSFEVGSAPTDPFQGIAAVNYLLGARTARGPGRRGARPDLNPAFALLSPGLDRRWAWTRSWLDLAPSRRPALRRLRRRAPLLERVVRGAVLCVRLAGALVLAAVAPLLVLAARREPGRGLATS